MDEVEEVSGKDEGLLVDKAQYLSSGVHIGTRQKTGAMSPYIYRPRSDGLFVLDVYLADERIRLAARLIAHHDPEKVLVVSARQYGQRPVTKFGEITSVKTNAARFTPGTLTNPSLKFYMEPDLLVVTDPVADKQPLSEAATIGLPVIGLCDTDNETKYIDLVVPTNNRGRKSLSLVYWLLAQCVLRERGDLSPDEDFKVPLEEFETEIGEE